MHGNDRGSGEFIKRRTISLRLTRGSDSDKQCDCGITRHEALSLSDHTGLPRATDADYGDLAPPQGEELPSQGSRPPRIWAILGARAGDNGQVLALARALGWPFEIKQLEFNRLHLLGPRLLGCSIASLTPSSRHLVSSDAPPDLTISVGHRSVSLVQWLRRRSGGRTRSVHIGFPRISPAHFDLVLTTPQYPVPDCGNVVRISFALGGTEAQPTNDPILAALPSPRRLLIVGGPNIYWKLDEPAVLNALASIIEDAARQGGSVLVTISPRTPPPLAAKIADVLEQTEVPTLLAAPGEAPSYPALLAAADSIQVTADSVAMVSDAIWTGKPMALVPIRKKLVAAVIMGVMDRLRPGRPVYPQDLRFFWRALEAIGVGHQLVRPRVPGERQRHEVVERVRSLLQR